MLKRFVMVTCAVITPATAWPASQADSTPACRPAGSVMRLSELPEASGLVASRVTPGRLWAHNDSGKPEIFALDAKGTVAGSVSISGAALEDWEALASGACGNGACLYIGDIGDNNGKRGEIIIYRVPEPAKAGGSAQVDAVFRASYPDGAHDAEALLAGRSLSPVVAMADRARKIGVESLNARLPVANPRDELGLLAETFNELLARLETSVELQRQFMADASHELRTPVTIARTAARVALQQPTRTESEYRETLEIVEQETIRLSRIVDDMFTLTRADAGNHPVRTTPMYLDEVVDDVVRGARVVAATRDVSTTVECVPSAAFTGDEELIRRLIINVLDNAIRYSPGGAAVRVALDRVDAARTHDGVSDGGAGLGLALARWIAQVHGGNIRLAASSRL